MAHPTLQFRSTSADRFAIVDQDDEHYMVRVDNDLAPRDALKHEIATIRRQAAALLRKANLLEASLDCE